MLIRREDIVLKFLRKVGNCLIFLQISKKEKNIVAFVSDSIKYYIDTYIIAYVII